MKPAPPVIKYKAMILYAPLLKYEYGYLIVHRPAPLAKYAAPGHARTILFHTGNRSMPKRET